MGMPTLVQQCNQWESVMKTYDPDKSPTEVRQANPRKMNLRVLVTSMIGVIVLFAIIFAIFVVGQPETP